MIRTDIYGVPAVVQKIQYLPLTENVRVLFFDGEEVLYPCSINPKKDIDYWVMEQFLTSRKLGELYASSR